MKVILIILFTLATASSVCAQHPIWIDEAIRVDNPGELAYWTAVEPDCPLSQAEAETVIEGVLARSGIEPLKHRIFEDGRVYLNFSLRCTKAVAENKHAFSVNIHFGRYKPLPAILFDAPYAALGIGNGDSIREQCKLRVEDAVSAFIKANTLIVGRQ